MDLHGLPQMFGILHTFLIHRDFLDVQPQQSWRQFSDICVLLCLGNETVSAGDSIPQILDGGFLRMNLCRKLILFPYIRIGTTGPYKADAISAVKYFL